MRRWATATNNSNNNNNNNNNTRNTKNTDAADTATTPTNHSIRPEWFPVLREYYVTFEPTHWSRRWHSPPRLRFPDDYFGRMMPEYAGGHAVPDVRKPERILLWS